MKLINKDKGLATSDWLTAVILIIISLLLILMVTARDPQADQPPVSQTPSLAPLGTTVTLAAQYQVSVSGVSCRTRPNQPIACQLSWRVVNVGGKQVFGDSGCSQPTAAEILARHFKLEDDQGNRFSQDHNFQTCQAYWQVRFAANQAVSATTSFFSDNRRSATKAIFELTQANSDYWAIFSL